MESLACLDGELVSVDEARVPIGDRGFLFGDAVYEVMRIYRGRCWLEAQHFARLSRSLDALEIGPIDLDQLAARVYRTIAASDIQEGTAYLHLTRGVSFRQHHFPHPPVPPTELIVVRRLDDEPLARMRETGSSAISHPDLRWKRCDIKSTNLLANVLACEAAYRAGCFEAILVNDEGMVTEATHTSVVWVRDGRLEGTPEGNEILPGTTRQLLTRLAEQIEIPLGQRAIGLKELAAAEEIIFVGTTSEVMPVVRLDGVAVGNGQPGKFSRLLHQAYRREVGRWLEQPLPAEGRS